MMNGLRQGSAAGRKATAAAPASPAARPSALDSVADVMGDVLARVGLFNDDDEDTLVSTWAGSTVVGSKTAADGTSVSPADTFDGCSTLASPNNTFEDGEDGGDGDDEEEDGSCIYTIEGTQRSRMSRTAGGSDYYDDDEGTWGTLEAKSTFESRTTYGEEDASTMFSADTSQGSETAREEEDGDDDDDDDDDELTKGDDVIGYDDDDGSTIEQDFPPAATATATANPAASARRLGLASSGRPSMKQQSKSLVNRVRVFLPKNMGTTTKRLSMGVGAMKKKKTVSTAVAAEVVPDGQDGATTNAPPSPSTSPPTDDSVSSGTHPAMLVSQMQQQQKEESDRSLGQKPRSMTDEGKEIALEQKRAAWGINDGDANSVSSTPSSLARYTAVPIKKERSARSEQPLRSSKAARRSVAAGASSPTPTSKSYGASPRAARARNTPIEISPSLNARQESEWSNSLLASVPSASENTSSTVGNDSSLKKQGAATQQGGTVAESSSPDGGGEDDDVIEEIAAVWEGKSSLSLIPPPPPLQDAKDAAVAVASADPEDRDYHRDSIDLLLLIMHQRWDEAARLCAAAPEEAASWVTKYHDVNKEGKGEGKGKGTAASTPTPPSAPSSSFAPRLLQWRVLPLHAAVVHGAPERTVAALLAAYPEGARGVDDRGLSPLHLAMKHGSGVWVVNLLLAAYPAAVEARDEKGRVPLDLAEQGYDGPDREAVVRALRRVGKSLHGEGPTGSASRAARGDDDVASASSASTVTTANPTAQCGLFGFAPPPPPPLPDTLSAFDDVAKKTKKTDDAKTEPPSPPATAVAEDGSANLVAAAAVATTAAAATVAATAAPSPSSPATTPKKSSSFLNYYMCGQGGGSHRERVLSVDEEDVIETVSPTGVDEVGVPEVAAAAHAEEEKTSSPQTKSKSIGRRLLPAFLRKRSASKVAEPAEEEDECSASRKSLQASSSLADLLEHPPIELGKDESSSAEPPLPVTGGSVSSRKRSDLMTKASLLCRDDDSVASSEEGDDSDSDDDSDASSSEGSEDESVLAPLPNTFEVVFRPTTRTSSGLSKCTTLTPSTVGSSDDRHFDDDDEDESVDVPSTRRRSGKRAASNGDEEQSACPSLEESVEVELTEQEVDIRELLKIPKEACGRGRSRRRPVHDIVGCEGELEIQ